MSARWTIEDENYLHDNWGYKPLFSLEKTLGRSQGAIMAKAKKMKLGDMRFMRNYTIGEVSEMLCMNRASIHNWIKVHGLIAYRQRLKKRVIYKIAHRTLKKWLSENQGKWCIQQADLEALGLTHLRVESALSPKKKAKKWTDKDRDLLKTYTQKGFTIREISIFMNRSQVNIKGKRSARRNGNISILQEIAHG